MPRLTIPLNLAFQFENSVQPPAYGAAAVLTSVSVATNAQGQAISQPAHQQMPVVAEDITDELLAALDAKARSIGLQITRVLPE